VSDVVPVTPHPRRRLALVIAIAADALQVVLLPLFAAVVPAVVDDAIDIVVAIVMIRLLGWHWAFLPSFLAELIPGVGLLPTWTAAVWFVTRKRKAPLPAEPPAEPSLPKLP
jgi:hypothetical protein